MQWFGIVQLYFCTVFKLLDSIMGKKVIFFGKEVELIHVKSMDNDYGTNEILDVLVDSEDVEDRKQALQLGYGLDKLCDDPDPEIAAKARELYYVE